MRVRIVVADRCKARFYELEHADEPLELVGSVSDPNGRLHDRDFKSDRPGRVFDSAPPVTGRRGARSHHSTGSERSPHRREAELFARQVVDRLDVCKEGKTLPFVLVAEPRFLGILRTALPDNAKHRLIATVAKNLIHEPEAMVRNYLPPEVFDALGGHTERHP